MNEKQKRVFDNLLGHDPMMMRPFDSSAQILQEKLQAMGITPPVKLYYEYQLPDNQTPEQFERFVQKMLFIDAFQSQQILDTAAYYLGSQKRALDYLGESGKTSAQEIQPVIDYNMQLCQTCQDDCAALSPAERKELADYITGMQDTVCRDMRAMVKWMKEHNPELKSVRVDGMNMISVWDFINGIVYGFAPEEIDYFLNTDGNTRNKETDELYRRLESFGIKPGYFIRPDRAQKILDCVVNAHIRHTQNMER